MPSARTTLACLSLLLIAAAPRDLPPSDSLPRSLSWQTPDNHRGELTRGKIAVVLFATPDGDGPAALRTAQTLFDRYQDLGVTTVAVLLTKDRDTAARLISENKLTLPVHFDPRLGGTGLARQWGVLKPASHAKKPSTKSPKPPTNKNTKAPPPSPSDSAPDQPGPTAFLLDPTLHVAYSGTIDAVAARLPRQLELTPPHAVDERTYGTAIDALALAQDMLAAGKPRSAARYLAQLPPESRKDATVAAKLAALTTALDQSLPDLLAETEQLAQQNRQPEAILLLEQCAAALKGTPSEAQVLDQLHSFTDDSDAMKEYEKGRPAALCLDLLDTASDYESRGDLATAYRLCREALDKYPNTPGAADAQARITIWESTPEEKRKLHDAVDGEKANALLSQADSYRRSNLTDKARSFYEQILKDYPDTTAAEKARAAMEAMK
jgi:TolA-binding protein